MLPIVRAFKTGQKPLWNWVFVELIRSQLFCPEIPPLGPLGNFSVCISPGWRSKTRTRYLDVATNVSAQ